MRFTRAELLRPEADSQWRAADDRATCSLEEALEDDEGHPSSGAVP